MSTVDWRLKRLADDSFEDALFDVEVIDAVNRFGRHSIAYIDDVDGDKWDVYPRGAGVELEVSTDGGSSYSRQFAGFVVERRERDSDGADELELDIYSYDHFLRRNNVTRDFSGKSISAALQEIVEDFTPVAWVAGNVSVQNDTTLSRDFRGEKVDNAIAELASKSAGEEFGVNDDLEFFFRPRETTAAPRGIDNTQWLDYDIPEAGKEAVNEIQLYYGTDGNEGSVVVTDGADKQDLQDSIGTDSPVTLREEVTREDIQTEAVARDKAEELLNDRGATLTGTVTTFGLFGAKPGQVIPIEIVPRGLDDDYRIAELRWRWGDDETEVTIVENTGQQDETLVRLTDTLKRVEQRPADRDVAASVYEGPLVSQGLFTVTATVTVRSFGTDRFTPGFGRDEPGFGRADPGIHLADVTQIAETTTRVTIALLNAVRDGWQGDSPPSISTIPVGDGDATPARTDSALDNELFELDATVGTSGDTTATFTASTDAPQSFTIEELGLEDDGDQLFARLAVASQSVDENAPLDIQIEVDVGDDADADGVITTLGSGVVRDIVANNTPSAPTQFAFGTGDANPAVGDTALDSHQSDESIDGQTDRQVGEVDTIGAFANSTGGSLTMREWGLKNADGDLLARIVYADIILEDGDTLNAKQRHRWLND